MTAKTQGRRARANGDAAETLFHAACEAYAVHGMASVFKRPTDYRVVRRLIKGGFACVPVTAGGCDYAGVMRGGRALLVEVKSSTSARMPIFARQGVAMIKPQQASQLSEWHDRGALCLVVVKVQDDWWAIHWPEWEKAEQDVLKRRADGGTRQASFSKDDLDFMGFRLPMMAPYGLAPDWLAPWRNG